MRKLANISSFEGLQNQAHRSMGMVSDTAVFNDSGDSMLNGPMFNLVKAVVDGLMKAYPDAGQTELNNLLRTASNAIYLHIKQSPEFEGVDALTFCAKFRSAGGGYIQEQFKNRGKDE